jgi:hypothetical protein
MFQSIKLSALTVALIALVGVNAQLSIPDAPTSVALDVLSGSKLLFCPQDFIVGFGSFYFIFYFQPFIKIVYLYVFDAPSKGDIRVSFEAPLTDGGSAVQSYTVEWDTDPGVQEVQSIST